jgi:hypothetical protein
LETRPLDTVPARETPHASPGAPAPPPPAALRTTASPWTLARAALGGPREIAGKLRRAGRTLRLWLDRGEVGRRLAALEARGLAPARPTRLQLLFGGADMLRFLIEPGARDYYRAQGISFGFHQLLRVLDDPVSMIDPTGFFSERDTVIGHLMQVTHLNPIYDVQLLQCFPDGLDELERQVEQMLAGTHPRRRTIGAIVEDPGYHARLLDYVRRYRRDPASAAPPVREQTLRDDPHFAAAERTFATLPGFLAYSARLPRDVSSLVRRARGLRAFPLAEAPAR